MQASVQPPHNELLYQGYVTEELEKAKKQAASTDTQWQSHDSVWESLNKKYGVRNQSLTALLSGKAVISFAGKKVKP